MLPESLVLEKRTTHLTLNSFNTFSQIKDIFKLKKVRLLLIVGVFFYAGLGIFQFNFTIFLKDIYLWTPAHIGGILTFVGVSEILTRAVFLPWLLKHFNEKNIGIAGLVIFGFGLGLILASIFIHSAVVISFAVIFIISGEGLFDPTFNGKLSQSVGESQQGKLQGVNQSLQAANNVLVPLGAAAIYFFNPGILYAMAIFIVLMAIIMYVEVLPHSKILKTS